MEQLKQLHNAIDQATSDALTGPDPQLYIAVENIANQRADMPKHLISYLNKRLLIKNRKVLYLVMDMLEFLSYQLELSLYSQISTKDFLLRISGLLQSKDLDEVVLNKILSLIRCWEELFRPHQDLLPMFFQFYDGLTKKGYDQRLDYVSPYRPKQLKKYSKPEDKRVSRQQPSKSKGSTTGGSSSSKPVNIEAIKEQILLANEIIDAVDPAEGVKGNTLLTELITSLKESEKVITSVINNFENEKAVEEALAINDDLIITYRRYKDLQKNRRPEPFIKTELASEVMASSKIHDSSSNITAKFPGESSRIETKPQTTQNSSIFDDFDKPAQQQQPSFMKPAQKPKPQPVNILDLDLDAPKPQIYNTTQIPAPIASGGSIFDMMDLNSQPQPSNIMNTMPGGLINPMDSPMIVNSALSFQPKYTNNLSPQMQPISMQTMSTPMQPDSFNSLAGLDLNGMAQPSYGTGIMMQPAQPASPTLGINNSLLGISLPTQPAQTNPMAGLTLQMGNMTMQNPDDYTTQNINVYSDKKIIDISGLTNLDDLLSRK